MASLTLSSGRPANRSTLTCGTTSVGRSSASWITDMVVWLLPTPPTCCMSLCRIASIRLLILCGLQKPECGGRWRGLLMWIDDRLKLRKDKTKEKIDFYNISSGIFFYYVFFFIWLLLAGLSEPWRAEMKFQSGLLMLIFVCIPQPLKFKFDTWISKSSKLIIMQSIILFFGNWFLKFCC